MSQKSNYSIKPFLIWFFANILGFSALGVSVLVFPSILTIAGLFPPTFLLAFSISFAQWIALRRMIKTSILWILTIPISIPLLSLIASVIPAGLWFDPSDDSIYAMTMHSVAIGLMIGLLQWIILRQQLARTSIWCLGSAVAVAGSIWLILVTDLIHQFGILAYIVVALVYSSVTGLVLSGLLAYNHQSQIDLTKSA